MVKNSEYDQEIPQSQTDPVPVLFRFYPLYPRVLGPILFLIFINDQPTYIKSSVHLFVNDCVLYTNIHSWQDCLILQENLESCALGGRLANAV